MLELKRLLTFARQYLQVVHQALKNDVEHIRLTRRVGVRNTRGTSGFKPIDPFFRLQSSGEYGPHGDILSIESVKWYGVTTVVESRRYSSENLLAMVERFDEIVASRIVKISEVQEDEYDRIVGFCETFRSTHNPFFSKGRQDFLIEYMDRDRFVGALSKRDTAALKLIKDDVLAGYSIAVIETTFDDLRGTYDKRLVIKDVVIDPQFQPFNLEYYLVERYRRICKERGLHRISVEVVQENRTMVRHLRNIGFVDKTFQGELDLNEVVL